MRQVHYAHFSDEETEGQGGEVRCLRDTASNSQQLGSDLHTKVLPSHFAFRTSPRERDIQSFVAELCKKWKLLALVLVRGHLEDLLLPSSFAPPTHPRPLPSFSFHFFLAPLFPGVTAVSPCSAPCAGHYPSRSHRIIQETHPARPGVALP